MMSTMNHVFPAAVPRHRRRIGILLFDGVKALD